MATFGHGKDFDINLGTSGAPGTPADASVYCNACDLGREKGAAETTVFQDANKTYLAGLLDGTFSIEGYHDETIDAWLHGLLEYDGEDVDWQITPQSGGATYSGHCICTKYDHSASVDGVVGFSAEFQITGAVSRA